MYPSWRGSTIPGLVRAGVRCLTRHPDRPCQRIGVALCTYNGARYLQAQLDSILDQDLPVNEVMIGGDGSSDQTLQLLQAFVPRARWASGVEIVQHAQDRLWRNFADALMRCQADILFLSTRMMSGIRACPPLRAALPRRSGPVAAAQRCMAGGAQGAPLPAAAGGTGGPSGRGRAGTLGPAIDAILLRNFITGATCARRVAAAAGSLPVPPGWSHDEWLAVHASLRGGLDMLAEPTIDYRQHGNNQIGASRRVSCNACAISIVDLQARQRTAGRLLASGVLLAARVVVAPSASRDSNALAWRMAWSRLQPACAWRAGALDRPRCAAG
jgi:hypothetical protein